VAAEIGSGVYLLISLGGLFALAVPTAAYVARNMIFAQSLRHNHGQP
jgi:hypothetical protein